MENPKISNSFLKPYFSVINMFNVLLKSIIEVIPYECSRVGAKYSIPILSSCGVIEEKILEVFQRP